MDIIKTLIKSFPLALTVLMLAGVSPEAIASGAINEKEGNVLHERVRHVCWDLVGEEILDGVNAGARSIRGLPEHERDDVVARALEKAWRALSIEQLDAPRAWGRAIARNTALDLLRRRNADPLAGSADVMDAWGHESLRDEATPEALVAGTQLTGLRDHVERWPEDERSLALAFLDGDAATITAAAKMVRTEQGDEAGSGAMYPAKARTLLLARCQELEGFHDLL